MVTPDEPITPKADQRVLDGEVVKDGRSQSRARKSGSPSGSGAEKPLKAKRDWFGWWPQTFTQKVLLLSLLVLIGIVVYLVQAANRQDWQIEKINQLQSQIGQLKAETHALKAEQAEMQASVTQQLDSPDRQPVISQGDLDAVQSEMESLKAKMQAKVSELSDQLKQVTQQAGVAAQQFGQAVQPTPEEKAQLQAQGEALGQELKNQLQQMGQQLSDLFHFKEAQQAHNAQQKTLDIELESRLKAATESAIQGGKPLSAQQIQQWTLEINTQWMLTGNVTQTEQQLRALEKAVNASEVANKTDLIRRIGQDMVRIHSAPNATPQNSQAWVKTIRAAIQALPEPMAEKPHSTSPPSRAPDASANDSVNGTSGSDPAETLSTDSAWQKLLNQMGDVFSVHKRESSQQLTQVESLIMHDVLVQRGLLLVDRIEWALNTQSKPLLDESLQSLEDFMAANFPTQLAAIQSPLQSLHQVRFASRQELDIVQGLQP